MPIDANRHLSSRVVNFTLAFLSAWAGAWPAAATRGLDDPLWIFLGSMAGVCPLSTPLLVFIPLALTFRNRGRLPWRFAATWIGAFLGGVVFLAMVPLSLKLMHAGFDPEVTTPVIGILAVVTSTVAGAGAFFMVPTVLADESAEAAG